MIKKLFLLVSVYFTLFSIVVSLCIYIFLEKEINITKNLISDYQYEYLIKTKFSTLNLIDRAINEQYIKTLKSYKRKQIELLQNNLKTISLLLSTLNNLQFKKYQIFLYDIFVKQEYENIKAVNLLNKIVASSNILELGSKYKMPCSPLENNGVCEVVKNGIYYYSLYIPSYSIFLIGSINIKTPEKSFFNSTRDFLLNIPDLVVYQRNEKLKGNFKHDSFYILQEFKPLDILFAIGIKYEEVKYFSKELYNKLHKNLKYYFFIFVSIYIVIIGLFYIILLFVFRKKFNIVENFFKKYESKAITDRLTGLYNREGFEVQYNNYNNCILIIVDLDNFKYINDTFGHEKGDYVLIQFTSKLKKLFKNDLIGRWGGDEFLICTQKQKKIIEKNIIEINDFLYKLQIEFDKNMTKILSASAGAYSEIDEPFEERFKKADLALYKVKKSKKGRCIFFKDINYIQMEKQDLEKQ